MNPGLTCGRRCTRGLGLVLAALMALVSGVQAQPADSYPSKPIRLIVPFPAGGGGDILARLVMTQVARELGQPLIVENVAGAGGNVGSQAAVRAPADGYTVLYGTNGTFGINHTLYKSTGFDPARDFEPVSRLTRIATLVVVRPDFKAATMPALLSLLKASPGKYTYGSAGNGTTSHLAAEVLKSAAGFSLVHIPYRGGAAAITDLIGGQVDVMIEIMPNAAPQVRSGRLRALAVSTAQRVPAMPDVPTIAESGVPGFDVSAWDAIFVPKGTPPAVIARLEAATQRALASPELRKQLQDRGAEASPLPAAEMGRFVAAEIARWGAAVKRSGATVD
jgi:tripartite-type tricarboxylate transporter receptor subunit TctC